MMEQTAIFSATLGLSPPWQVTEVNFARESNRLDLKVEYRQGKPLDCPTCGAQEGSIACETIQEIWYHEDFLRYATYLHAHVPVMKCCCGSEFPLERPWSRVGSRFAKVA